MEFTKDVEIKRQNTLMKEYLKEALMSTKDQSLQTAATTDYWEETEEQTSLRGQHQDMV